MGMLRLTLFVLLPSIGSSSLAISVEEPYVGPQPCPSNKNILGYSSIEALNNDMVFNSLSTSNVTNYILCPHTEYDMSINVLPILPTQNNSKIQCGKKGESKDNCVLSGGKYQIYFHRGIITENVEFHGLIFKASNRTSVGAYSNAHSSVKFFDCQWTENEAIMLVEVFHKKKQTTENRHLRSSKSSVLSDIQEELEIDGDEYISYFVNIGRLEKSLNANRALETSSKSNSLYNEGMNITFEQCSFFGNDKAVTLISTFGGLIDLSDCLFLGNNAAAITVGIASHGTLSLKGTTFRMNTNQFSTIFIDPTSTVITEYDITKYAFAMSGIGNSGNMCQDVFIESRDSNCLGNGGYTDACYGSCCHFSDMKCVNDQKNANKFVSSINTTSTSFNEDVEGEDDTDGNNLIKGMFNNTTVELLNETFFNNTL